MIIEKCYLANVMTLIALKKLIKIVSRINVVFQHSLIMLMKIKKENNNNQTRIHRKGNNGMKIKH